MKKFFVLYMAPASEIQKWMTVPEEDRNKWMEDWKKWMDDHKSVFVDEGTPLGKTKKVTAEGISDTKNEITYYSIVQAESHDAAAQIFLDNPNLKIPGAFLEIMEVREMSGM